MDGMEWSEQGCMYSRLWKHETKKKKKKKKKTYNSSRRAAQGGGGRFTANVLILCGAHRDQQTSAGDK